jgi:hypothetical protein
MGIIASIHEKHLKEMKAKTVEPASNRELQVIPVSNKEARLNISMDSDTRESINNLSSALNGVREELHTMNQRTTTAPATVVETEAISVVDAVENAVNVVDNIVEATEAATNFDFDMSDTNEQQVQQPVTQPAPQPQQPIVQTSQPEQKVTVTVPVEKQESASIFQPIQGLSINSDLLGPNAHSGTEDMPQYQNAICNGGNIPPVTDSQKQAFINAMAQMMGQQTAQPPVVNYSQAGTPQPLNTGEINQMWAQPQPQQLPVQYQQPAPQPQPQQNFDMGIHIETEDSQPVQKSWPDQIVPPQQVKNITPPTVEESKPIEFDNSEVLQKLPNFNQIEAVAKSCNCAIKASKIIDPKTNNFSGIISGLVYDLGQNGAPLSEYNPFKSFAIDTGTIMDRQYKVYPWKAADGGPIDFEKSWHYTDMNGSVNLPLFKTIFTGGFDAISDRPMYSERLLNTLRRVDFSSLPTNKIRQNAKETRNRIRDSLIKCFEDQAFVTGLGNIIGVPCRFRFEDYNDTSKSFLLTNENVELYRCGPVLGVPTHRILFMPDANGKTNIEVDPSQETIQKWMSPQPQPQQHRRQNNNRKGGRR